MSVALLPADQVAALDPAATRLWCSPRLLDRVRARFPFPTLSSLEPLPPEVTTLVAVGGGTRLDAVKLWRFEQGARWRLIAVPSRWGSGAEVSPIAVSTREGKKHIVVDPGLLPDGRVVLPELVETLSDAQLRWACGDAWSHALEGFLSPLAEDALRAELAALMKDMIARGVGRDPAWFELSARACEGQARSSVGLVHGIAHVLEPRLEGMGHARLCATLLLPVFRFDSARQGWEELWRGHGLEPAEVEAVLQGLFDPEDYARLRPLIVEHWKTILRDRCTRTNCVLVRPASRAHFEAA